MKKANRTVLALIAVLVAPLAGNAAVITFDNVAGASCNSPSWGGSIDGFTLVGSSAGVFDSNTCGFLNADGAFSGDNMMLNFNSQVGTLVRDDGTFDFNGAYFRADDRDGTTDVAFAGYDLAGDLVFSSTVALAAEWTWIGFDWGGIKTFTWDPLTPNSTSNISIDDFTYNEVAAVPGPGALALLGFGLLGLGWAGRKRL